MKVVSHFLSIAKFVSRGERPFASHLSRTLALLTRWRKIAMCENNSQLVGNRPFDRVERSAAWNLELASEPGAAPEEKSSRIMFTAMSAAQVPIQTGLVPVHLFAHVAHDDGSGSVLPP